MGRKPKVDHDKLEKTQAINLTNELRGTVNYLNAQRKKQFEDYERLRTAFDFRNQEVTKLKKELSASTSLSNHYKKSIDGLYRQYDRSQQECANWALAALIFFVPALWTFGQGIYWVLTHVTIHLI